ncbi:MAG: glycoside hydrolase family 99-like domain-containing protein [Verrucomicrobiota bacterium JB024]|nr:glycoside hydrolase family 99-like domain-containing protein [Verrucomicrobiota bacterium JB024]
MNTNPQQPLIAAYYFPNFHVDVRNERVHGTGWTEWEVLKQSRPRFENHRAPFRPVWGYEDEADPEVMANKIRYAKKHGVDAFIFDWYYYDDGDFLNGCLENGYMKAAGSEDHLFALMWANHDWRDIAPAKLSQSNDILHQGKVTEVTMLRMADVVASRYFSQENYLRIDGCPYFSIYELCNLIEQAGGLEQAAEQLQKFRERVREVSSQQVHLNGVVFRAPILPGERVPMKVADLIAGLGLDSITSYVWTHYCPQLNEVPFFPYTQARDQYLEAWRGYVRDFDVPCFPNVTVGWDPSPRTLASDTWEMRRYPFSGVMTGNTPELFGDAISTCLKEYSQTESFQMLTINAWNEWTEGSYLEPDDFYGYAYLEAIAKAKTEFVSALSQNTAQ